MCRSFTLSPFSKSAAIAPQDSTGDAGAGYALLNMLPQGDALQVELTVSSLSAGRNCIGTAHEAENYSIYQTFDVQLRT
jgi:hypothetical protein